MATSHAQDRDLTRDPEAALPGPSAHDARLGDSDRLSALQQSRLLDTAPEPAFDRLTELAKRLLAVPITLVSLVDHDRQFFKSQQGLAEPLASDRQTPLSYSFCQYVVAEDAPFVVEDARTHPLVQDNLATRDLGVVAYLGVPVHSPDGQPLGSICAIDTEPRAWTDDDRTVLLDLAAVVESEIWLRAEVAAHTRSEAQFRALFEASPDAVLVLDPVTESVVEANSAACVLYGCTRDELSWASLRTLLHGPTVGTDIVAWLGRHGGTARYETVQFRADGTPFDVAVGASLVRLDDRPVVLAVNRDVTERNRIARTSAARAAFRETIADALRSLSDPTEIKAVATQLLGEYLGASRVHYGEIDDEAYVVVDRDYTDGAVSVVGRFRKEEFNPALARAHDAGQSVVTPDIANAVDLSDLDRAAYAAARVAAQVCVPLIKGERLVAVLAVHQREPRDWTAEEVALVEEAAERTWTAVGRARAEAALRESEAQFRALTSATSDVMYRMGPDWTEMRQLVGGGFLADTEEPRRDWAEGYIHPDDRALVDATIAEAVRSKGVFELEHRVLREDGTVGWTSSRAVPLLDERGEIAEWFGAASNVTEQKRAETVLRASVTRAAFREALSTALRSVTDPTEVQVVTARALGEHLGASRVFYAEADPDGDRIHVPRDYCDGVPSVAGTHSLSRFGARVVDETRAGRTLADEDTDADDRLTADERAAYAALSVRSHLVVPVMRAGRLVGLLGAHQSKPRAWTAEEVALAEETAERTWSTLERARAEAALQTSEERLRLVSHATNDAVCDWDMRTDRFVTNPAFGDLFGWHDEAADGFDNAWMVERMHPDDRARTFGTFRDIMAGTETSWRSEHRFERADGTWADVLERGYILREDGVPVRTIGSMLDLSALKATERALVEAKEAAEQAREAAEEIARAKSSLLMNMSHEIRTPLTAVIGYAELLGDECGPEQTEQREYAAAIESGGRRLLATLNSVLDLAQIEAGALPLAMVAVDLRAEAEAAVVALHPLAQADGLALTISGPPTTAQADRAALARVLTNLVGNAIKFTEHGTVAVEVWAESGSAWLRVSDTGVGIEASFLPHMFEDFKQESSGANRAFEGSGLGLAITRGLVAKLGGAISVESEKGVGSTFTVRFPAA